MSQQYTNDKKTVCLDFNGCLDTYVGWKGPNFMYPPRPGVELFLSNLCQLGYKLIICTAANIDMVNNWLVQNGLDRYINKVTNEKPPAIVYLDDRAICFDGDFAHALSAIINFQTHWENKPGSDIGGTDDN